MIYLAALLLAGTAFAQTTIGSRTAATGSTMDFRNAGHTRTLKVDVFANIPATCTVGEGFFASDKPAGQNIYGCTSTNTWTLESGSGGSTFTGSTGSALGNCGASPVFSLTDVAIKSPIIFNCTLNVNVTSPTITNKTAGARFDIQTTTPSSAFTWSWNSIVSDNVCPIYTDAAATTTAHLIIDPDGTTVHGEGCDVTIAGLVAYGATVADPASNPSSGNVIATLNTHGITLRDSAGVFHDTVKRGADVATDTGLVTGWNGGAAPASAVIKTNGSAQPTAVTGTGSNCVHVDGTSAACGGGSITITEDIFLPTVMENNAIGSQSNAGAWDIDSTATAPTLGVTGGTQAGGVWNISNSGTPTLYHRRVLPSTWTGNIDFAVWWADECCGSGNVKWTISLACAAAGSGAYMPVGGTAPFTFNTSTSVTTASGGAGSQPFRSVVTSLSTTNCATNSQLVVQVQRDNTVGGNVAGVIKMLYSVLTIRRTSS